MGIVGLAVAWLPARRRCASICHFEKLKKACHPERSEGSDYTGIAVQILRFAQDDKLFFSKLVRM
jgi:hypothetical protein